MIYVTTSIKEVIARIIRATRVQDTSFIRDMDEWIPEAMGLMKTKYTLKSEWEDVTINFHKGVLPCRLRSIKAVEHNGHRLKEGNTVRNIDAPISRNEQLAHSIKGTTNGFETIPQIVNTPSQDNPQENSHYFWSDLRSTSAEDCNSLHECEDWYQVEMGYLSTSLRSGKVRVHFRSIPCDQDGFPLIPDNDNYKKAIEYYVIAAMIGAGFKSPVHDYYKIMQPGGFWDIFSAKAMGEIRYPTTNSMEYKQNILNRLIKDEGYFDQFFSSPNPEKKYGFDEYLYNVSTGGGKTYINPPNTQQ